MQLLQQFYSFITSPTGQVLLAVVAVLGGIGGIGSIVGAYYARRGPILTQPAGLTVQRSKFPFECLTVDKLVDPKVLQKLILTNADIRYVPRLSSSKFS